ncbi:hypothetical protein [Rhizobium sp. FY34]|uniref:hypothetical protein n=1 Tax=Rhizobium sp. FY34 TaxID=2562309 RepID=UPI001484D673|nr:hypothetical protein [Rhizobium sp. FY34]
MQDSMEDDQKIRLLAAAMRDAGLPTQSCRIVWRPPSPRCTTACQSETGGR